MGLPAFIGGNLQSIAKVFSLLLVARNYSRVIFTSLAFFTYQALGWTMLSLFLGRFTLAVALFKEIYVRFLRQDVPGAETDPSRYPVWAKLREMRTLHGTHRGGAAGFGPENTLYNYRRAVDELKTHILEFDLRLTKDGKIAIMHDDTVDRTTNGTGRVNDLTLEQIRELDAAHHYPALRGTGIKVPVVEEILDEFASREDVVLLFDIKDVGVIPHLKQILDKWDLHDKIIFCAVLPEVNAALRKAVAKSYLITPDILSVIKYIVAYMFALEWLLPMNHAVMGCVAVEWTRDILSPSLIANWHARGLPIFLFGDLLDSPDQCRRFVEQKVDMLLTDRPDVLRAVLDGNDTYQIKELDNTARMEYFNKHEE